MSPSLFPLLNWEIPWKKNLPPLPHPSVIPQLLVIWLQFSELHNYSLVKKNEQWLLLLNAGFSGCLSPGLLICQHLVFDWVSLHCQVQLNLSTVCSPLSSNWHSLSPLLNKKINLSVPLPATFPYSHQILSKVQVEAYPYFSEFHPSSSPWFSKDSEKWPLLASLFLHFIVSWRGFYALAKTDYCYFQSTSHVFPLPQ